MGKKPQTIRTKEKEKKKGLANVGWELSFRCSVTTLKQDIYNIENLYVQY